jgi:hypothetical protein
LIEANFSFDVLFLLKRQSSKIFVAQLVLFLVFEHSVFVSSVFKPDVVDGGANLAFTSGAAENDGA